MTEPVRLFFIAIVSRKKIYSANSVAAAVVIDLVLVRFAGRATIVEGVANSNTSVKKKKQNIIWKYDITQSERYKNKIIFEICFAKFVLNEYCGVRSMRLAVWYGQTDLISISTSIKNQKKKYALCDYSISFTWTVFVLSLGVLEIVKNLMDPNHRSDSSIARNALKRCGSSLMSERKTKIVPVQWAQISG